MDRPIFEPYQPYTCRTMPAVKRLISLRFLQIPSGGSRHEMVQLGVRPHETMITSIESWLVYRDSSIGLLNHNSQYHQPTEVLNTTQMLSPQAIFARQSGH